MPAGDLKTQVIETINKVPIFKRLIIEQDRQGILSMRVDYDIVYNDPDNVVIGTKELALGATQSKMMEMPNFLNTYVSLRSACRTLLKEHDSSMVEE